MTQNSDAIPIDIDMNCTYTEESMGIFQSFYRYMKGYRYRITKENTLFVRARAISKSNGVLKPIP